MAPRIRPALTPLEVAIKEVKAAYITAKKAYRISNSRRARVQEALNAYLGTRNFHNYTIQKKFSDPSAKRVIRSFNVGKEPVIINDTEWLSLKVHGQSFMMHQIRKMIAMVVCVTDFLRRQSANSSLTFNPGSRRQMRLSNRHHARFLRTHSNQYTESTRTWPPA